MRPDSRFLLALFATVASGALVSKANAEIITDGAAGAATTLTGPAFAIPETLGTQAGANLFHSFQTFNVGVGESATFTGPAGIDNVISRVTGGTVSTIAGALNSNIPGADFYFINPAGVTFTAGASVNVPAGFHVSTAGALNFANGDVLLSAGGAGSTFSSAAITDFGFLGARMGEIRFDNSIFGVVVAHTTIITPGEVSLVARDVTVTANGDIETGPFNYVLLRSPSPGLSGPSLHVDADRFLLNGGTGVYARTNDAPGGNLVFDVREFRMDRAYILRTESAGAGRAGDIVINADTIDILDSFEVRTRGLRTGSSGDVRLTANRIDVESTRVSTASLPQLNDLSDLFDPGGSGAIRMEARTINLRAAQVESAAALPFLFDFSLVPAPLARSGAAGPIDIRAHDLTLLGSFIESETAGRGSTLNVDFSQITSLTQIPAMPPSGNVTIIATGSVLLDKGSSITSRGVLGDSGNISVRAPTLTLVGGTYLQDGFYRGTGGAGGPLETMRSAITTQVIERGSAGDVDIRVGALTLLDGGVISSETGASVRDDVLNLELAGAGGGVSIVADTVEARGSIRQLIDFGDPEFNEDRGIVFSGIRAGSLAGGGPGGSISIEADTLLLGSGASVSATTESQSDAGAIIIRVDNLQVLSGSQILTDAEAQTGGSAGAAGSIQIDANTVVVNGAMSVITDDGQRRVHSNLGAFAGPGAGQAGSLSITADSLRLLDGGQITAFSNNQFDGGTVTIDAETVEISGLADAVLKDTTALYGVGIEVSGVGLNSGFITDTFSSGAAGTIIVRAQNISFMDGGVARSNTSSAGRGGTIIICPDGTLIIDGVGSALLASSAANSTGDAGIIGVQADRIAMSKGGRVTVASAGAGQGGQIVLQAHQVSLTNEGGDPNNATAINTLVTGAAGAVSVKGAGQIALLAGQMNVSGGSIVTTDTEGTAPAGRIVIRAGTLNLEGASTKVSSASPSANAGDAGTIDIGAFNVQINGATISTLSEEGAGGQVLLAVDNRLLLVRGKITTEVHGDTVGSDAGNISIGLKAAAPEFTNPCEGVCKLGFDAFLGVTRPNSNDGVPTVVVNDGGRIVGSAEVGSGGGISIDAGALINSGVIQADPDSFYDVRSESGPNGFIALQAPTFALPTFTLIPDIEYRSMCEAQQRGEELTFEEALGSAPYDPTQRRFEGYHVTLDRVAQSGFEVSTCSGDDVARNRLVLRRADDQ